MVVGYLDTEVTKKPRMFPWNTGSYLCSVGLAIDSEPVKIWVLQHKHEPVESQKKSFAEIQEALNKCDVLVGHNIKFDLAWLRHCGFVVDKQQLWCTAVADYIINGQYGLDYDLTSVSVRLGGTAKIDKMAEYWEQGFETDEIPLSVHLPYLTQDVELTRFVYNQQVGITSANGLTPLINLCCTVSGILSDMERTGVAFDESKANQFYTEYQTKLIDVDKNIYEIVGEEFNIGSGQQLSAQLYGGTYKQDGIETYNVTLKSGEVKTRSRKCKVDKVVKGVGFTPLEGTESEAKPGVFKTNKEVLKLLKPATEAQEKLLKLLKDRANADTILTTFKAKKEDGGLLRKIGYDGRIHPSFNQCVTATGRLSSSNPNGQNLPRKGTSPIKQCFVSKNGVILNFDLAQIEFRIAAELSRDPLMIQEIKEGVDVHAANAIAFFGAGKYPKDSDEFQKLRTTAKIFMFRLLYGGSPYAFFKDPKMPEFPLRKWEKIVADFYKKYKVLGRWQKGNVDQTYNHGYIRNPSGRILRFKLIRKRGVVQYNDADIFNYPVQSASADIMFLCMATVSSELKSKGLRSQLLLQVHDSLVVDAYCDEVEKLYDIILTSFREVGKATMKLWNWELAVPIDGDCEIGNNYGQLVKLSKPLTPASCELKDAEGNSVTVPVTTYAQLIATPEWTEFNKNYKLAKIVFKE